MKVAFLSESPADEAAVRILAQALLPGPIERVDIASLRSRGWPSILGVLPVVIRQLHYHTLADGLVVVVDNNDSPVHAPLHEGKMGSEPRCRVCQLRAVATRTLAHLRPIQNRPPLKWAVGAAVPAIEAWYLFGVNPQASEAGWISGVLVRDRNELKRQVYGTARPSLAVETAKACEAAHRIGANVADLEAFFPGGFGTLALGLRAW